MGVWGQIGGWSHQSPLNGEVAKHGNRKLTHEPLRKEIPWGRPPSVSGCRIEYFPMRLQGRSCAPATDVGLGGVYREFCDLSRTSEESVQPDGRSH